ncbi:MAG: ECF transporter S component [Eubacteriaceae bacterium]|nr:ECF transporter S component [Eubacteriaceae bacterium]
MRSRKTVFLVQFAALLALEAITCFTPLGSLPIGPIVATLAHIPVIITAAALGTGAGTLMGFITGIFSLAIWTFMPPQPFLAFVFTPFYSLGEIRGGLPSLLISVVPRTLIGFATGVSLSAFKSDKTLGYVASGIIGSCINTFLVLGGIYVFYGRPYAAAVGLEYSMLLGAIGTVIATNGIMEAALGGICCRYIGRPLKKIASKQ